jgi:hypothetical protein
MVFITLSGKMDAEGNDFLNYGVFTLLKVYFYPNPPKFLDVAKITQIIGLNFHLSCFYVFLINFVNCKMSKE